MCRFLWKPVNGADFLRGRGERRELMRTQEMAARPGEVSREHRTGRKCGGEPQAKLASSPEPQGPAEVAAWFPALWPPPWKDTQPHSCPRSAHAWQGRPSTNKVLHQCSCPPFTSLKCLPGIGSKYVRGRKPRNLGFEPDLCVALG